MLKTMTASTDILPSFEPHAINLSSEKDSKITNVNLYPSRAEVTRTFKLNVNVGLNQANITGLPNVLDEDSLKVEGTGLAVIHDVAISEIPLDAKPSSSPQLEELLRNRENIEQAIDRYTISIRSLEAYLGTLNVKDVGVSQVANVVKAFLVTAEELHNQLTELRDKSGKLSTSINAERKVLSGPSGKQDLRTKVAIMVFADVEGEVEIKLIYAIGEASWDALYDIRVDTRTQEEPIELTYKASITQGTGEDWTDVNLTLETVEPTFGIRLPQLPLWTVSVHRPHSVASKTPRMKAFHKGRNEVDDIQHQKARVTSTGNITATFGVPGKMSIPSDEATHNVTVAKMNLKARMHWVTVPKQEAKTHLIATIKNASEYTLLHGQANVYVDGSFIARTQMSLVSPEESFDCPLGLDPSIRVTYHTRTKKINQSGFYNKITTHAYTQRITVFNTKPTNIDNLKVTDQFPISDDSIITVKHINPALVDVFSESGVREAQVEKVKVSPGILAQWNGADKPDIEMQGKDGKFDWVCSIPPQGKIDLFLRYDVIAPHRTDITGL